MTYHDISTWCVKHVVAMLNVSKNGSEWSWSLVVLGTIGVDFKLRRLNLDGLKLALQWRQGFYGFRFQFRKGWWSFHIYFFFILFCFPFLFICSVRIAKVHVWDMAGQRRFRVCHPNYQGIRGLWICGCLALYHRAAGWGVVIIFDITDRESFNNVVHWAEERHCLC